MDHAQAYEEEKASAGSSYWTDEKCFERAARTSEQLGYLPSSDDLQIFFCSSTPQLIIMINTATMSTAANPSSQVGSKYNELSSCNKGAIFD